MHGDLCRAVTITETFSQRTTGFSTRLSVTNGKLYASQASIPPSSGRTLVIPLARSSSATRRWSLRWVTSSTERRRDPGESLRGALRSLPSTQRLSDGKPNLGEQATPVAGNHRVEVVDRRVHVHGRARDRRRRGTRERAPCRAGVHGPSLF